MVLNQHFLGKQLIKFIPGLNISSGSSGHNLFNIFLISVLIVFRIQEKIQHFTLLWCNVLNIEPKEEKATKPLVCEKHFSEKDLRKDVSKIVPKFTTRKNPKKHNKKKKRTVSQKSFAPPELAEHFTEIKTEPVGETTVEELCFDDVLDSSPPMKKMIYDEDVDFLESLLPQIAKMNVKQKRVFRREMMSLKMNNCS